MFVSEFDWQTFCFKVVFNDSVFSFIHIHVLVFFSISVDFSIFVGNREHRLLFILKASYRSVRQHLKAFKGKQLTYCATHTSIINIPLQIHKAKFVADYYM